MAEPAKHIDPMAFMLDQIADRITDKLLEQLQPSLELPLAGFFENPGLNPMKVYSSREVAELLGTNRIETIYAIPENELPRVKRIGSRIGYLGINLLCYMHNLPPVDMQAVIESYRERIMQGAPKVKPLHLNKPGMPKVL